MPVITLTTEWQGFDYYSGVLKGKLAKLCPDITVIDNATGLPPFNIQHSAFVVRNTFHHFPDGSIHIICIQSEYHKDNPHLLVEAHGHFFIAADNGIFNLILNSEPDRIIRLDENKEEAAHGELGIFANAASAIATGKKIEDIGNAVDSLNEKVPIRATIEEGAISGSIIFIDSYGNVISNITRDVFTRVFKKKRFRIAVRSNTNSIDHISNSYNSEIIGDLLAIFNSLDLLEIGLNGTDASELLSLQVGDVVRVDVPGSDKKPGTLF